MMSKILTPCFVFNKEVLDGQITEVKEAFNKYWNNYIFSYSVKTNSLPALSHYLRREGVFAEVVSQDEFELVKNIGYLDNEIICNGPIKNKYWLLYILDNDLILNIDSFFEVKFIVDYAKKHPKKVVKVGIRGNLDIEKKFEGESKGGLIGSRFGFSYQNEDFSNAINSLKEVLNIKITGLHLHISTHTRQVDIYKWIAKQFLHLVKKYDLQEIEYLDIGGGFFGGISDKRNWENYISGISEVLKEAQYTPDNLSLIIEPGVSLLAGCFNYYSKVHDVKSINDRLVILLDGSRIHIDPIFNRKKHLFHIEYLDDDRELLDTEQMLVGCTCMENDRILSMHNAKELKVGDMICFEKVGAYTMTLSPLFINYFPPVYMYDEESQSLIVLRKKWKASEMLQGSNLNSIK